MADIDYVIQRLEATGRDAPVKLSDFLAKPQHESRMFTVGSTYICHHLPPWGSESDDPQAIISDASIIPPIGAPFLEQHQRWDQASVVQGVAFYLSLYKNQLVTYVAVGQPE